MATTDFAGRVAIVTGSTRGIGQATAELFARRGAAVVVCGRSEAAGVAVAQGIEAEGGVAHFVALDVGEESSVRELVERTLERFGRIDVLVNNAAPTDLVGPGRSDNRAHLLDSEAWERIIRVGLTSVFWTCKYALPHIVASGGGAVVNVSSGSALLGVGGLDAYTAAKGGVVSLSRALAVEYAGEGVRVNCIAPGMIISGPNAQLLVDDPVVGPAIRDMHLTRLGASADVAETIAFLCSDRAGFLTGLVMPVDGGVTARFAVPDLKSAASRFVDRSESTRQEVSA